MRALVLAAALLAVSAPTRAATPPPSLAQLYRKQFRVGAAVSLDLIRDPRAEKLVLRQFDVIVAEHEMKPLALARGPGPGQYDFAAADALVDWATQHGIKVRGHCLVWHRSVPGWMFYGADGKPLPREQVVDRMRTYIHDVVGHFKGRVWAWDVVNEAFVPWEPGTPAVDGWRKSPWYDALGPEYLALAFRFAQEADPGAMLFYNDYDTDNAVKRDMIVAMARDLRAQGIRIDGVGHQAHVFLEKPEVSAVEATIRAVAALGLKNQITEMDMSLRAAPGAPLPPQTPELLARQARRWGEYFRMFRRNAGSVDAVLTWGVNDEASWLGPPDGVLLFSGYEPKPAFWAVVDAARGTP